MSFMQQSFQPRGWMKPVLAAAGAYNLVWGLLAVCFPTTTLSWAGFDPLPRYPQLWQCIGMIVGVYGIGYLIAAKSPYRHWPIVLVGLLGKLFGPMGFLMGLSSGELPMQMGWTLLLNDLIWWVPFSMILWGALRYHQGMGTIHFSEEFDDPIRELVDQHGRSLDQLSKDQPQLVVLLRHSGCTFCRESLSNLASQMRDIQATGCGVVLVHLEQDDAIAPFLSSYGLEELPRISDPECRLYRQFGLDLGNFRELFGISVWIRGFIAGVWNGHGAGRSRGNVFQMPGAFVVHAGRILQGFKHITAADRPNYLTMTKDAGDQVTASRPTVMQ
ncbi:MAG: redoxin domain-containing protein [Planctomycetaceae bacterium]|nr:redoxin domain-containing protein [Planctomycetaceae bacterium]